MRRFVNHSGAGAAWATAGRGRGTGVEGGRGGRGRGAACGDCSLPPTAPVVLASSCGLGAARCPCGRTGPGAACPSCAGHALATVPGFQCRAFSMTAVNLAYKQRGRNRGRGRAAREPQAGDWTCACGSTNGFSRRECFKCQAPAPPLPLGQSRPKLPGEDPHDWACPCGKMNYRGNVNCHKCGMPKPVAPQAAGAPSQMWRCKRCRSILRAKQKFCIKCGAARMVHGEDYDNQAAVMEQQQRHLQQMQESDPYAASYGQSSSGGRSDSGGY